MIYLFGLFLASFLFVLTLLKRDKRRPDFIMLVWMGVVALHIFLFFLDYKKISYQYPHLLGITLPLPILQGVLLYFYTIELIRKTHVPVKIILMHLVPFFLLIILAIPFYRLSAVEKIEVFQNQGKGFEWYSLIQISAFLISGFGYSIAAILEIRKHRKNILNSFSNVDKKMLRWLEFLAIGLAIIWLLSAFFNDQVIFVGVVIFVLFIGFFGINQYPVFYSIPTLEVKSETQPRERLQEQSDDTEKYARSGLNEDEASKVMALLETTMKSKKPFANANLTLNDLATSISVSPNHLSQAINMLSGKTFYHYINTYRIYEFLERASLPENKKFTYLGLAFQCGFTSKTTFNKYFKLQTGKTPSEYYKVVDNSIDPIE